MFELLSKAAAFIPARYYYAFALLLCCLIFALIAVLGQKFKIGKLEIPKLSNVKLRAVCGAISLIFFLSSLYVGLVSVPQNSGLTSNGTSEQTSLQPSTSGRTLYTAANFDVYSSAAQAQFIPAWQNGISFHIRAELSSITQDVPDYLQFGGAIVLRNVKPADFDSLNKDGRALNALAVASTLFQPVNYKSPTDGYQASTTFLSMFGLPDGQQISFPLIKDDEPGGVNFGSITMMNSLSNTWGYYVLIALASKCLAYPPTERCNLKKLQQVLISARAHLGPNNAFLSSEFSKLIKLASR